MNFNRQLMKVKKLNMVIPACVRTGYANGLTRFLKRQSISNNEKAV